MNKEKIIIYSIADIDKLRKDVKDDEKDTVIKVVIDDALEQFSK